MQRAALAVVLFGYACSTTVRMERPFTSEGVAQINSMLAHRNATVIYVPGSGEPVKEITSGLAVTPDLARWTVWESDFARDRGSPPGQPVAAPIAALRKIVVCDGACRPLGALEGAGFGLLVGAAGAAALLVTHQCRGEACEGGNPEVVLVVPVLTTLIGALIGTGAGHRTVIDVNP